MCIYVIASFKHADKAFKLEIVHVWGTNSVFIKV